MSNELEVEKKRRIYYQDIVYAVCNLLDRLDEKKPGQGIICGTVESPSAAVQDRLRTLVDNGIALRTLLRHTLRERGVSDDSIQRALGVR
mgnify:CR=1 FL=1